MARRAVTFLACCADDGPAATDVEALLLEEPCPLGYELANMPELHANGEESRDLLGLLRGRRPGGDGRQRDREQTGNTHELPLYGHIEPFPCDPLRIERDSFWIRWQVQVLIFVCETVGFCWLFFRVGPCGRIVSGGRFDRLAGLFLLEAVGAFAAGDITAPACRVRISRNIATAMGVSTGTASYIRRRAG